MIRQPTTNDSLSAKLIHYIEHHLNSKIIAIIPTHFHKDCLGGLKKFHQMNIPSYAYLKTITIAKDKQIQIPQYSFDSILRLLVGKEEIYAQFVGEGHSEDNIIGYFPKEKILFGGCLVKELGVGKGNLEDANIDNWKSSILYLKKLYHSLTTVIPGHGQYGNSQLLDYTISLFQ
ncbi:MAG: MBL fold metallo-hydrolase [Chitinophagaceae bacterium]